ncbi:DUF2325 domain-containing protein [Paucibacter aquatile]|uniref:DUF2325 domain-containing protein n=1 Tax=Kinneretia aquatilis TaxID=2070761 RepID=A0A2N8L396_9BURK|nr:DUF2325 domain-containing protein [Paucibacter aquatile]PND40173.1 DUF2325 domain-containing protein [Paucibacter aquatile]
MSLAYIAYLAYKETRMCDSPNVFTALIEGEAQTGSAAPALLGGLARKPALPKEPAAAEHRLGSRRRRLWELPSQALCPVIGVCLPMPLLRRRLGRLPGINPRANDYELHCLAIDACGQRSDVAELLQRELDQRFIRTLRLAATCKTTLALAAWWAAAAQGQPLREGEPPLDVAACFWATLTHARCEHSLQEQVLRDIHMLQHQVGAANRADLGRLEALADENAVLAAELARVQQRSQRVLQERAAAQERQAAELVQLRAQLLGRDNLLASLRDDMQALEAAAPGLRHRQEQAEQIRHQLSRIQDLERALLRARQDAALAEQRQRESQAELQRLQTLAPAEPVANAAPEPASSPDLGERAVLCVGGRPSVVPIYRQLIEGTGGRFLHHDGGEEDAVAKLDASLAAADLVICQTGCISHDAYWRVKDHCKRHGKRCVYVESPSASSLRRALGALEAGSSAAAADDAT